MVSRATPVRLQTGNVESWTVGIRAFEAVAGKRAVDEFRVEAAQALMVHAGPGKAAGADIGEEHVSFGRELADDFLAFWRGCVDDDGFLAAIVEVKDRIVLIVRADGAEEVADRIATRGLDLDYFSAPVREDAPGTRRCHIGGVFNDFQTFVNEVWTLDAQKGRGGAIARPC